jgi:hypothetical protein
VAYSQNRRVEIETLLMENAWPLFQAGDEAGFARHIADIIQHTWPRPDAIVLAQASMAGAADLLKHAPVPVLASPRLGVAASLGRLTASAGRADMAPGTSQGRMEQGRMA